MAVQAALLSTHPFVPFGFGGSPDGLGSAFGALDKGCCFEDEETGTPAGALLAGAEGGDVREATRDLPIPAGGLSSPHPLGLPTNPGPRPPPAHLRPPHPPAPSPRPQFLLPPSLVPHHPQTSGDSPPGS